MKVRSVVVAIALASPSAVAHADEADQLFQQGQALVAAGKIDEGCAKFAASLKADPQLGTALNLADCREQQRRYVDAYRLFANAEVEAIARHDKRASFARQRQQSLAKRVVRIKVQVEAPNTRGLTIRIADRTLRSDEWSTVQVTEPGVVAISAAAPGFAPYQDSETGAAGAQLTFEVPALTRPRDSGGDGGGDGATTGTADPGGATPDADLSRGAPAAAHSKLPFVVGGAGAALLITGIALGFSANSSYDDLVAEDPRPPDVDAQIDSLQRRADIGTVVGAVGLAAVATGVILFIRDRRHSVVVAPTSTSTSVGLALSGSL